MTRNFRELLEARWAKGKFVCVGLDSDLTKIPECMQVADTEDPEAFMGLEAGSTITAFNRSIIDETHDLVLAYKPNTAFYEEHGPAGWQALKETIGYIHQVAPEVPVILDAKRGDIGNTNFGYVRMAFDYLGADAITVHPYLGAEAVGPFLELKNKGIFVLCRTSNKGGSEFQSWDILGDVVPGGYMPLYEFVAHRVFMEWNKNGNCGLVVGATHPAELQEIYNRVMGSLPFLLPGIGAQGGDLEKTVAVFKQASGRGMIINSSRGIIFASKGTDFADAARRETLTLHNAIQRALKG